MGIQVACGHCCSIIKHRKISEAPKTTTTFSPSSYDWIDITLHFTSAQKVSRTSKHLNLSSEYHYLFRIRSDEYVDWMVLMGYGQHTHVLPLPREDQQIVTNNCMSFLEKDLCATPIYYAADVRETFSVNASEATFLSFLLKFR